MLPALEAFSEFRLTVLAYNSKGAGPESRPYTFQTPEGGEGPCVRPRGARESELRPRGLRRWLWKGPQRERLSWVLCFPVPEQPAFLKVVKVDRDAATVAWGLPEKLNGHLVGFLLQYQTSAWGLGGRGLALREPGGGGWWRLPRVGPSQEPGLRTRGRRGAAPACFTNSFLCAQPRPRTPVCPQLLLTAESAGSSYGRGRAAPSVHRLTVQRLPGRFAPLCCSESQGAPGGARDRGHWSLAETLSQRPLPAGGVSPRTAVIRLAWSVRANSCGGAGPAHHGRRRGRAAGAPGAEPAALCSVPQ